MVLLSVLIKSLGKLTADQVDVYLPRVSQMIATEDRDSVLDAAVALFQQAPADQKPRVVETLVKDFIHTNIRRDAHLYALSCFFESAPEEQSMVFQAAQSGFAQAGDLENGFELAKLCYDQLQRSPAIVAGYMVGLSKGDPMQKPAFILAQAQKLAEIKDEIPYSYGPLWEGVEALGRENLKSLALEFALALHLKAPDNYKTALRQAALIALVKGDCPAEAHDFYAATLSKADPAETAKFFGQQQTLSQRMADTWGQLAQKIISPVSTDLSGPSPSATL